MNCGKKVISKHFIIHDLIKNCNRTDTEIQIQQQKYRKVMTED